MTFFLDTHLLIWVTFRPEKLPEAAAISIRDPENSIFFSVVTLWEVAIKASQGRTDFNVDPRNFRRLLIENDYNEMAIQSEHALVAASLPAIHKDPFDRMLIAQATVEGITLLTSDATIARYPGPIRLV